MKLYYSKDCEADILQDMLNLNPLSDDFILVNIDEYSQGKDNIEIILNRPFYSHEKDTITGIIESYSVSHPLYIRKKLERSVSAPAMIQGQAIMAEYAAMNLYAQKSLSQYMTIFSTTKNLMSYLISGSLEMAAYELGQIKANLPADNAITDQECDEFLRRLQVAIKNLKG